MVQKRSSGSLILPLIALWGCVMCAPLPASADSPPKATELPLLDANRPTPLRLDVEDSVKLTVLDHPELTQVAVVQRDGMISLPLIGEIKAEGRTLDELRSEVIQRLNEAVVPIHATLRMGDQLRMTVWQHADLTLDATVRPDGYISLPLAGEIIASGESIAELTALVRERLSVYLRDPHVTLALMNPMRNVLFEPRASLVPERLRERSVAVLGEVVAPGMVTFKPNLRVMDALALAHHKDGAKLNDVVLIRSLRSEAPQYRVLRLEDFLEGNATDQNIYLQPDDIVVVPKSTITKIGDFIDKFFTRTRPIFDWWKAAVDARYAKDNGELNRTLNEKLLAQ